MTEFKLILLILISISFILISSCRSDQEIEEICIGDIIGFWDVTDFAPLTSNCQELTSYQFMTTDHDNILSVTIINEDQTLSGSGSIDEDC